jgi:diacylglycerol kinase (ATP)
VAEEKPFTFTGRIRSFRFAFRGLRTMLLSQHNAWVHAAATIAVILAGILLKISTVEWCAIIVMTVAVWTAEALNTAFEFLCDVASPQFHPVVEKSKDVAAGAVLLSAIGAIVVGVLIFGPRLIELVL